MHTYLTELLGRPVVEPDGRQVGRVYDVIATQGDRLPILAAVFARGPKREAWFSIADAELADDKVQLRQAWDDLPQYTPGSQDVRLQRDVLDKQIVDVQDYRVVRANDVRLAACGDRACVVGVDASLRAVLRRAGVGRPVEAVAKLVGHPLRSNLIAWDDIETLEPSGAGGGRIRLKVPHEKIAHLHPADIADIVEQLDPQQRAEVIESLDVQTAADTIEEMEEEEAAQVIESLEHEKAADILDEMEPDDAADLLSDLPDAHAEQLLQQMEPEEAADVKELLAYEEETAGGVMTTEYIAIAENMTADDTIGYVRQLAPRAESAYYLYVIDADERLVGVLSLRDLIVADPATCVVDFMVHSVRHVQTGDDIAEVAQIFGRYNLLALPVVDDDSKLVGIVTVDDIMELLLPPERRRRIPQLAVGQE